MSVICGRVSGALRFGKLHVRVVIQKPKIVGRRNDDLPDPPNFEPTPNDMPSMNVGRVECQLTVRPYFSPPEPPKEDEQVVSVNAFMAEVGCRSTRLPESWPPVLWS
jgi:hypothetical protein